jgi:hypothetical protein
VRRRSTASPSAAADLQQPKQANEIVDDVTSAARGWRIEAKRVGLSRADQDAMAAAFDLADRATG